MVTNLLEYIPFQFARTFVRYTFQYYPSVTRSLHKIFVGQTSSTLKNGRRQHRFYYRFSASFLSGNHMDLFWLIPSGRARYLATIAAMRILPSNVRYFYQ